ncbi:MAG TPA: hypothetical protein VMS93_08215 [Candidatus Saccharimonadales bacterium]|nr:hypothetical protein [Candidatus Saccharimonadales bacterium]
MKRISVLTVLLILLLAPASHAQFFGQTGPLGTLTGDGIGSFGGYLGFGSGTAIAGTGQVRIGMCPLYDLFAQVGVQKYNNSGPTGFGAQVGGRLRLFKSMTGSAKFMAGGDVAVGLSHIGSQTYEYTNPFTGETTTYGTESSTIFHILAVPVANVATKVGNGQVLSGWGGFGLEFESSSGNTATTGVIRLGGEFDFTKKLGVTAEWNHATATGGGDAFEVGVNFLRGSHGGSKSSSAPAAAPAKKGKGK